MKIINLTPHSVEVYLESQFVNLEQANPTTWFADEVVGDPLGHYPSEGVARMVVTTAVVKSSVIPGEVVKTVYGDPIGIPEDRGWDYLFRSLPMQLYVQICRTGLWRADDFTLQGGPFQT